MSTRRYDIDNIRVLATLAIFLFHNLRLFDTMGWHVKNSETAVPATIVVGMLDAFLMPLFFLLSGVGAYYGLSRRSATQFLKERVLRLLLPLYTAGFILLLPPQFALDRMTNGVVFESWKDGYLQFFKHVSFSLEPLFVSFFTGHLWFLNFLFYISLVCLPLLLFLRTPGGEDFRNILVKACCGKIGPFALALPLFIALFVIRGFFQGEHTWADFVYFSLYFLIGYGVVSDSRMVGVFQRWAVPGLVLGILGFCGEGYFVLVANYPLFGQTYDNIAMYTSFQVIMALQTLGWVVAVLGFGSRFFNEKQSWTAPGNESVLPFYMLHQTVILLVGWYVVRLGWGIPAKLAINLVLSFALISLIYMWTIRPFKAVRLCFGMRVKR